MSGVLALMKNAVIADTCCNQLNCLSNCLYIFCENLLAKGYILKYIQNS